MVKIEEINFNIVKNIVIDVNLYEINVIDWVVLMFEFVDKFRKSLEF